MKTIINPVVEVFKTNVQDPSEAKMLVDLFQKLITNSFVNFDLDDCDKVLRIEGIDVCTQLVTGILEDHGYICELLE